MSTNQELNRLLQTIEQNGVDVNKRIHGFIFPNLDFISPHITILMCWSGTARIMYDMQERTIKRNDMNIILPGHLKTLLETFQKCTPEPTLLCSLNL